MNYEVYRNNIIREYVDYGSRMHLNCIRHDPGASDLHKDQVENICRLLRKNKVDYVCRAVIEQGYKSPILITDVFAITEPKPTVIEVIDTETEEHVQEKLKKYPDEFRKVFIRKGENIHNLGLI